MVRRDLFKKQSDPFYKALHKLLGRIGNEKEPLSQEQGWEKVEQLLNFEKNIKIEEVLVLPSETSINQWVEKQLDLDHLDLLADLLVAIADKEKQSSLSFSKLEIYSHCLALYRYVEEKDLAFSLQRHQKIQRLALLIEG